VKDFAVFKQFFVYSVACMFRSGNKIVDLKIFAIFRSFGNITPNYNTALMGKSDSLYELSSGT
jgi:hypothetical protein